MISVLAHCTVSAVFFFALWLKDWARMEASEEEHVRQIAQLARQHEREVLALRTEIARLQDKIKLYQTVRAYGVQNDGIHTMAQS